jgi:hypothetical protein
MFKTYFIGAKILLRVASFGTVGAAIVIIYFQVTGANPLTSIQKTLETNLKSATDSISTVVAEAKPETKEAVLVDWGPIVTNISYGYRIKVADIKSVQMQYVKYSFKLLTYEEKANLVFDHSFNGYAQFNPKLTKIVKIGANEFQVVLPPLEIVLSPVITKPTYAGDLNFYSGFNQEGTTQALTLSVSNQFAQDCAIRNFLNTSFDTLVEKSSLEAERYYQDTINSVVAGVVSDNKATITIVRPESPKFISVITTDVTPSRVLNVSETRAITPEQEKANIKRYFKDANDIQVGSEHQGLINKADVSIQVQRAPKQKK